MLELARAVSEKGQALPAAVVEEVERLVRERDQALAHLAELEAAAGGVSTSYTSSLKGKYTAAGGAGAGAAAGEDVGSECSYGSAECSRGIDMDSAKNTPRKDASEDALEAQRRLPSQASKAPHPELPLASSLPPPTPTPAPPTPRGLDALEKVTGFQAQVRLSLSIAKFPALNQTETETC